MSPSHKPSLPEPVRKSRELQDNARNEQQKAILLSEVAHIRADLSSSKLIVESDRLLRQSRKTKERARQLRNG